jgi:signal peptidase I
MTEDPSPKIGPTPAPRSRSVLRTAATWLRDLAISIMIAVVVIIFIYQPVKVEGTSMMPGLVDQERIYVNKCIYRLGIDDIERGDLVVFWYPFDRSKSYIKRIIGLPGRVPGHILHARKNRGSATFFCSGRPSQLIER